MAKQPTPNWDFGHNPGKLTLLSTGVFFVCVAALGLLETLGVPNHIVGYGFIGLTILVYAVIGFLSRTTKPGEYYVAGRSVPAVYNGMATGADWISAASFVGMASTLFLLGYDGLAFVLGWTGGFVLVALLIAPFLRKFGAYTVPDFFAARYEGNVPRVLAVIVLVVCSFTFLVAQIFAAGLIAQRFLGLDFTVAVYIGLLVMLLCSVLGGMKAVTWTQVALYLVMIVAYLLPIVILSTRKYGLPLPHLTYGQALAEIAALEERMVIDGLASQLNPLTGEGLKPHSQPFLHFTPGNFYALILCLMVGTASFPHVLMRYFTTPSVRAARSSVAWSLLFISLLYFAAPAYAAFSKLEIYTLIAAKTALADLPDWVYSHGKLGLVTICGQAAQSVEQIAAACGGIANHPGFLRVQDFRIDTDAIVLSISEIAGMPYVVDGLVAAGAFAAIFPTAKGVLLAIANALSHDIYYKTLNPNAKPARRLDVSRFLLFFIAVLAAATAASKPADIIAMVAWATSLAAAGIFPALVLGIWWKGTNKAGCIAGMLVGFGICLFYLVVTRYFPGYGVAYFRMSPLTCSISGRPFVEDLAATMASAHAFDAWVPASHPLASRVGWMNIRNIAPAIFALPVAFLTIVVVTLMTEQLSQHIIDLIDRIRRPGGTPFHKDDDAAVP